MYKAKHIKIFENFDKSIKSKYDFFLILKNLELALFKKKKISSKRLHRAKSVLALPKLETVNRLAIAMVSLKCAEKSRQQKVVQIWPTLGETRPRRCSGRRWSANRSKSRQKRKRHRLRSPDRTCHLICETEPPKGISNIHSFKLLYMKPV